MTPDLPEFLRLVAGFIDHPTYERYVLDNGEVFTDVRVSDDRGEMKACYQNAFTAARDNGWSYVEGYATALIPVMHAWCVDEKGVAVEVTWETAGDEYMGVVMDIDVVSETILNTGVWGVMPNDYLNGHKLLEGAST